MAQPQTSEGPAELELTLSAQQAGLRLDVALTQSLPRLSRNFIRHLLNSGAILINGKQAKPSFTVKGGEQVAVELPEPEVIEARPENIPLEILFEDQDIIAVNKPAGMVTHPSSGHTSGSLVNALLFHCKDLSTINGALRPGIVHRLDKNTTGVIVAAKNDLAHRGLAEQFSSRTIQKEYLALCHGTPAQVRFFSDARIGRHPIRRTEMTTLRQPDEGRDAYTDFEVLERFPASSKAPQAGIFLVRAQPKTGRTHQIRVHLAKLGFPVLCDELYGREEALSELGLSRHALHARCLSLQHPSRAEKLRLEAKIPDDIEQALQRLRG